MASHIFCKDYETDNYYLINNQTGQQQQITKSGAHIKKFSFTLTGKLGFKDRAKQKDPCHFAEGTESLKKFPPFYIPQPDKFDGYAQLPCTLQKPFYNNQRPRSEANVQTTLDILSKQSFNNQYHIAKPISYITGTQQDFEFVNSTNKIKRLEFRKSTKEQIIRNINNNSVKIINKQEIQQPNLSLIKRRSRIMSQMLPKSTPLNISNELQETKEIIPLEFEKKQSLHQYQQMQSDIKESQILYESRTYHKSLSNSFNPTKLNYSSGTFFNVNYFNEKLTNSQKEEAAYQVITKQEKKTVSSKNRFSLLKTRTISEQYQNDRMIMKLFQPELFK